MRTIRNRTKEEVVSTIPKRAVDPDGVGLLSGSNLMGDREGAFMAVVTPVRRVVGGLTDTAKDYVEKLNRSEAVRVANRWFF